MRKNCANIAANLVIGRAASERSISTDGVTILSYALPIARRLPGNAPTRVEVLRGRHSPTHTTTTHINAVRQALAGSGVEVIEVDQLSA